MSPSNTASRFWRSLMLGEQMTCEEVAAGEHIGDGGEVGCAMLKYVHFEVAFQSLQARHEVQSLDGLICRSHYRSSSSPEALPDQNE